MSETVNNATAEKAMDQEVINRILGSITVTRGVGIYGHPAAIVKSSLFPNWGYTLNFDDLSEQLYEYSLKVTGELIEVRADRDLLRARVEELEKVRDGYRAYLMADADLAMADTADEEQAACVKLAEAGDVLARLGEGYHVGIVGDDALALPPDPATSGGEKP
jgi:hypothetical protein